MKAAFFFVLALAMAASGCAGSFEESKIAGRAQLNLAAPPPSERCVSLDTAHRNWAAIAAASGLIAGADGLTMIPYGGNDTARAALAGGVVAAGAVAIFATVESNGAASSWAAECSQ